VPARRFPVRISGVFRARPHHDVDTVLTWLCTGNFYTGRRRDRPSLCEPGCDATASTWSAAKTGGRKDMPWLTPGATRGA